MRSLDKSFGLSSRHQPHSLRGIHINISSDPFQHRIPPYVQRLWQESKLRRYLSLWKRRIAHKVGWLEIAVVGLLCVGGCMVLLLHVGFFSGKKYQDWQLEHYASDTLDQVDLLDKVYPDEGRLQTTAIVLVQQHELDQKRVILEQLCEYDMFATVTLWNDDAEHPLTFDMLHGIQGCTLNQWHIINAPKPLGSAARYQACHMAKTPYCYFQDVPKKTSQLRSLYANFLRSPHLIHTQSSDYASFLDTQWRYCFSNTNVKLHTCFVDIASGTFVAKAMVTRFLSHPQEAFADMYFMMYMNQLPYQLEGNNGYATKQLSQQEIDHLNLGLNSLYHQLEEGIVPLQPYLTSKFERNARASCMNDRCLFLTNKPILPNIELFHYDPSVMDVQLSKEVHDDYISNTTLHYMYAVDQNEATSWKSSSTHQKDIQAGDYIGLDLLMPMRTPLHYRFLMNAPYKYRTTMTIQIS
ncbi:hypothetical protein CU098_009620, partial [Rhizopus stolonifer]